jgi:hypothetical protein
MGGKHAPSSLIEVLPKTIRLCFRHCTTCIQAAVQPSGLPSLRSSGWGGKRAASARVQCHLICGHEVHAFHDTMCGFELQWGGMIHSGPEIYSLDFTARGPIDTLGPKSWPYGAAVWHMHKISDDYALH